MSLKIDLHRAVLTVLSGSIGIGNMCDEDFAFVEMVRDYGAQRDKDSGAFPAIDWAIAQKSVGTGAPEQPRPSTELDRGPEPQSVGETLDTTAPKPAEDNRVPTNFRHGTGADMIMPDYETIDTKAP